MFYVFFLKFYSDNQHADESSVSKSTVTKDFMIECDTPGRSCKNKNLNSTSFTRGIFV